MFCKTDFCKIVSGFKNFHLIPINPEFLLGMWKRELRC